LSKFTHCSGYIAEVAGIVLVLGNEGLGNCNILIAVFVRFAYYFDYGRQGDGCQGGVLAGRFRQFADFLGHNRESFAGCSGMCAFDCRIHRKQLMKLWGQTLTPLRQE